MLLANCNDYRIKHRCIMLTCEVNGSYTVVDCKHMSASSLNICLLVFILLHD